MLNRIILASKSRVRKDILEKNNISCDVKPSNVDEDMVKRSLLREKASPEIISKNLAELKANKVSSKNHEQIVLGADSVIDLEGELISKPENRKEALTILKKLNLKCSNRNESIVLKSQFPTIPATNSSSWRLAYHVSNPQRKQGEMQYSLNQSSLSTVPLLQKLSA